MIRMRTDPIIICGQGGSRTRLIASIFKNMNNTFLLKSSDHTIDSLSLRDSLLLNNIVRIMDKHKKCNYNVIRDDEIDSSMERFKEMVKDELENVDKDKIWGWKEPFSRYFLPYFQEAFPNMRVIYVQRDTIPSDMHLEGRDELFNCIFANRYSYLTEVEKFKTVRKKLDSDCIKFFDKNNIDYMIINTDDLMIMEKKSDELNRISEFIRTTYDNNKCMSLIASHHCIM